MKLPRNYFFRLESQKDFKFSCFQGAARLTQEKSQKINYE